MSVAEMGTAVPEYPVSPPVAPPAAVARPGSGLPPLVWIVVGVLLAKGFDLVCVAACRMVQAHLQAHLILLHGLQGSTTGRLPLQPHQTETLMALGHMMHRRPSSSGAGRPRCRTMCRR